MNRERLNIQLDAINIYLDYLEIVTKKIIPKKGADIRDAYFKTVNELRVKAGLKSIKKLTNKEKEKLRKEWGLKT